MDGIYVKEERILAIIHAILRPFRYILTFCNLFPEFAYTRKCQPKDFFLWHFLFVILSDKLVSKMLV